MDVNNITKEVLPRISGTFAHLKIQHTSSNYNVPVETIKLHFLKSDSLSNSDFIPVTYKLHV